MASSNPPAFGKRELHRVWSAQRPEGRFFEVSPVRCAAAIAALAAAAAAAAFLVVLLIPPDLPGVPPLVRLALAAVAVGTVGACAWAIARIIPALFRRGPILRLDPGRLVLRLAGENLVVPWEAAVLALGPVFLRITDARRMRAPREAETAEVFLVPALLLKGGRRGLSRSISEIGIPQAGSGESRRRG